MQQSNKAAKSMGPAIHETSNTTDKRNVDRDQRSLPEHPQKGEEKAMLNLEDLPSDKLIRD
ncbi:hypothetical protein N7471_009971 [Penicillium samsonianum]|uniref:uncharacterized protein n=1 Tax=Penicillium samsonianum TaxID=1882272 RepID=UPI00254684ED|nr:uncharacterized protein N7471_009971 [Penicillium samsonianum]KAJ6128754.1 hypothetical protein N7471_009971 [Penicillium samsonianum]